MSCFATGAFLGLGRASIGCRLDCRLVWRLQTLETERIIILSLVAALAGLLGLKVYKDFWFGGKAHFFGIFTEKIDFFWRFDFLLLGQNGHCSSPH